MMTYALSFIAGLAVGVFYAGIGMRSPAPPIIALLGLLGMLAGEQLIGYWRGHPDAVSSLLHTKAFSHHASVAKEPFKDADKPDGPV
jgi:XapX domain-containing protein